MDADREMIALAVKLGADEAVIASTHIIKVEDRFPEFYVPPQCDGYGQSANCPPHSIALFFRIDVPLEIMLAEERHDVNRLLQEMAATLERRAARDGCPGAWGIAADCCKKLFCAAHAQWGMLAGGACRNPDKARPSMSGMGINCNHLSTALGWSAAVRESGLAAMVGLVLLD